MQKIWRDSSQMLDKSNNMKRFSRSLAIKEMQIKTTMSYHYTLWLGKNSSVPIPGKNMKQLKLSSTDSRNAEWYNHCGKEFSSFLSI